MSNVKTMLRLPGSEAREVEAMVCCICGAPAYPAISSPMCWKHHEAWCDSESYKIARRTEDVIRDAWAIGERERLAKKGAA